MHYVYVLKSDKDDKWYVGCTANLIGRLGYHNQGLVRSTKARRPFTIIYREEFVDKYEAYKMERFYKTAVGKRQLKNKINNCQIV